MACIYTGNKLSKIHLDQEPVADDGAGAQPMVTEEVFLAVDNHVHLSNDLDPPTNTNSRKRSLPTEILRDNLEQDDGEHHNYCQQFRFLSYQYKICFELINFNTDVLLNWQKEATYF